MIYLITGLPGAGKTLFTVADVMGMAEKENRQVYFSGITDCKVPGWIELEKGEDWYKCPVGSIIIIDECQRVFRPRSAGSNVPEYVSKFETHRHQGLDVFLITQHPLLLDANVRRLVGTHRHYVRAFGAKASNQHEWNQVRENCDKSRSGSVETFRKYPSHVFNYYKSAELHTHKFRIPPRVFFLVLSPFLIGASVYYIYRWWQPRIQGDTIKQEITNVAPSAGDLAPPAPSASHLTRDEYLKQYEPRIEGLAYTAPAYDKVTEPEEAPVPVACLTSERTGCLCYSQQGTKLAMSQELCNNILEKGFFQPFSLKSQERQREQEENRRQRRQNNLQHVSDETAPPADSSPFVGAMTYQPPELSASPTLNQ